jgi:DNA-binding transcriptional LysR family regulator
MSIYSYEIFEIVSEKGSFAKAAAILRLTPSAVSHSIAKLEDDLGCQLFWRNRSGVELTEEGKRLLPYIKKIQASNDELLLEASRIRNSEVGLVKVGVFYSVAANWLPHILKKFKADCPGIEVEIFEGGYADISKWIEDRKVDIGFLSNLTAENMDYTVLKKEPLIYVTPPDFVPKNKTYVTIEEMKENELILQRECGDFDALAFLEANDIKVNSYYNMYEDQTLLSLAECGLGTAIMPGLAAKLSTSNVNRYPIKPEVTRTIVLAVPDRGSMSQATKLFQQHVFDFMETEESEV